MSDTLAPLILDFLAWIEPGNRSYGEVMEAWRTSCPRLPVWEDAVDRGYVTRRLESGHAVVELSPAGRKFLAARRS